MLSQKLVFDFEILLTLDELVHNQTPKTVISVNKLVLSQKLDFDFEIIIIPNELVLIQIPK